MRWLVVVGLILVLAGCSDEESVASSIGTTTLVDQDSAPTTPRTPTTATTEATHDEEARSTTTGSIETTLGDLQGLVYEPLLSVQFPIILTARPGDRTALLGLRTGEVFLFEQGEAGETTLDLSDRTTVDGERGLLGLARHPSDDGRLFVHYTDSGGDTVVSEFSLNQDLVADAASERVLVQVAQPASNHNGGMIQFGPDGFLYLGLGDGGGGGDRFGNAQNQETLLGGLVRIDIDTGEAELWHLGLRNPWRFWIDGESIWIADVGQNAFEEVDLAPLTEAGINYGWPITEGAHCYQAQDCVQTGFHPPLVEVERGDGGSCSITGGVVYRGSEIPELDGRFFFSDFCGGYLRSVDEQGNVEDHTDQVGVPGRVVSFGVDGDQEVYILTTDEVLRLTARR